MKKSEEIHDGLIAPIEAKMIRGLTRLIRDPDDAADAMQEILAVTWKDLKKIRGHPNPRPYIMWLCMSKAYEVLRGRRREVPLDDELSTNSSIRVVTPLEQEERVKKSLTPLRRCLATSPRRLSCAL